MSGPEAKAADGWFEQCCKNETCDTLSCISDNDVAKKCLARIILKANAEHYLPMFKKLRDYFGPHYNYGGFGKMVDEEIVRLEKGTE
jgi:hypothetical protein